MEVTVARRLNHPIHAVWITLAAYFLFVLVKLALAGFNPTVFINTGDRFAQADKLGAGFVIQTQSGGYDGQFFYRLSVSPFTRQADDRGIALDNPSYRHQRIVYPLLARIMSFGRNNLVPWGLIAANLAALAGLAWVGAGLALQYDKHALWGLVIPFFPGFLLSLAFDLAEIVQAALILFGIRAVIKERYFPSAVFLSLAVLTRESALIVPGVGLVTGLIGYARNDRGFRSVLAFATPLAAYVVWQFVLYLNWGQVPVFSGSDPITFPLDGFIHGLAAMMSMPLKSKALYILEMGFLIIFLSAAISNYRQNPAAGLVKFSWVVYMMLLSVLSASVWEYGLGFLRVSAEFFVLGAVILLASNRGRLVAFTTACQTVLWLALFVKLTVLDALRAAYYL